MDHRQGEKEGESRDAHRRLALDSPCSRGAAVKAASWWVSVKVNHRDGTQSHPSRPTSFDLKVIKALKYILCRKDFDVLGLVKLLIDNVYNRFGTPETWFSDR